MGSARDLIEDIGAWGHRVHSHTHSSISVIGEFGVALFRACKYPHKIRFKEALYYFQQTGIDSLPIVAMTCLLMGIILGFQAALQLEQFGTDIYVADLVGLSIVKELGPLMVAVISTGRAGSAFAAEIGTMRVNEEIDAMTTMGIEPSRFLFVPRLIAMVAAIPLLTVFGNLFGLLGGLLIGVFKLELPAITYINRTIEVITPAQLMGGFVKSIVFALLITVIGCMRGMQSGSDAHGVGRATTSAVVTGIFWIVIFDALLTTLFSVGIS